MERLSTLKPLCGRGFENEEMYADVGSQASQQGEPGALREMSDSMAGDRKVLMGLVHPAIAESKRVPPKL